MAIFVYCVKKQTSSCNSFVRRKRYHALPCGREHLFMECTETVPAYAATSQKPRSSRELPVAFLPGRDRSRCRLSLTEQRKGIPITTKLLKGRRELQQARKALPRVDLVFQHNEAENTCTYFVRLPCCSVRARWQRTSTAGFMLLTR